MRRTRGGQSDIFLAHGADKDLRMLRILAVLLFPALALAADYPSVLTWQHDGLDVNGDPETIVEWRLEVLHPAGNAVSQQTLLDPAGELRTWNIDPVELGYNLPYTFELRAVDDAGNVSEPGTLVLELSDTAAPTTPQTINVEVVCPEGYTCNVKINGVQQ